MAKGMLVVWSSPIDNASETDFNAWYEGTHIPQVRAAVPAITVVHRYKLMDPPAADGIPSTSRYLAVYELDTKDVAGAAAALGAAASQMDPSPAMDTTANPPLIHWYKGLTG
jgi:hypothetical protein